MHFQSLTMCLSEDRVPRSIRWLICFFSNQNWYSKETPFTGKHIPYWWLYNISLDIIYIYTYCLWFYTVILPQTKPHNYIIMTGYDWSCASCASAVLFGLFFMWLFDDLLVRKLWIDFYPKTFLQNHEPLLNLIQIDPELQQLHQHHSISIHLLCWHISVQCKKISVFRAHHRFVRIQWPYHASLVNAMSMEKPALCTL